MFGRDHVFRGDETTANIAVQLVMLAEAVEDLARGRREGRMSSEAGLGVFLVRDALITADLGTRGGSVLQLRYTV